MIKKAFFCLFFLCFSISIFATDITPYPFSSTPDAERFSSLIQEIRCVVCQNENLADSNAPLAADLRTKIYHMVLEKKSNEEIKNYLVKRYGEFILLRPRFNALTVLLWLFPFVSVAIGFIFIMRIPRTTKVTT